MDSALLWITMRWRLLPGKASLERIQESDICDDAASKLFDIFRLPFESLPHPSRLPAEGFGAGIQLLILF
jgi:hypothetical protein